MGTEFDALRRRGCDAGAPLHHTRWGEIAWHLGGQASYAAMREHDAHGEMPDEDVTRAVLPEGPVLIPKDETLNYISRPRMAGGVWLRRMRHPSGWAVMAASESLQV